MNGNLLEKYLENDLNESEKEALLHELQTNSTFAKEWQFQRLLREALQSEKHQMLKSSVLKELDLLEEAGEIQSLTATSSFSKAKGAISKYISENLELLQQWFTPYPYPSIARGGNLEVLLPQENLNTQFLLDFELKKAINLKLSLSIFNAQNELVFSEKIPPKNRTFTISLMSMAEELHPGWYYWQLGHSRIGEVKRAFFINAELNPFS
ncbi:MAG: hypothetical protein ACPGVB_13365 [Chitinophagales bacterium]